ncbi:hypothetical protein H4R33_004108 [Dimargaris cristalligena]|nr:hypothetical protein H4R33_004108 [Dimargaris cristalligena]
MKSSLLSVFVVGMALANFTISLPHGIGSMNTVTGGKSAPQLHRRAWGEKREEAAGSSGYNQNNKRMKLLAGNQMESDSVIMQMVRAEADYSAFVSTFSLLGKCIQPYGEEQARPGPFLSTLCNNYAELADWADSVEYVTSGEMDLEEFDALFPMVARALELGTSEIPELNALIARVDSYSYGPSNVSLSSGLPGLFSTDLPNDLTRQALRRIPYLVQGHLAAHYVVQKNLDGFKQTIRSWIARDRNDPTPSRPVSGYDDSTIELTNMPVTNWLSDVGPGAPEPSSSIRSLEFDPQNNTPFETSRFSSPYVGRSRLPIATLFMWALEYELIEAEELFTEFGNPFLKRDIPCLAALDFQIVYMSLSFDYHMDQFSISPEEHFRCYQQFTFQGHVILSPEVYEPPSTRIRVRHNRKLNPQVSVIPVDDSKTTTNMITQLEYLTGLVDYLENLNYVEYKLYPIRIWARSFDTAIRYQKNITSINPTNPNKGTTPGNESAISFIPENLVREADKIVEIVAGLLLKIEQIESDPYPIENMTDPAMANVVEVDSILTDPQSYSVSDSNLESDVSSDAESEEDSQSVIEPISEIVLNELNKLLQILNEKHFFRAAILEGLNKCRIFMNMQSPLF